MSNARSFSTGIIANAPSGRCMWDSFFPVGIVQTAYNVLSGSLWMSPYVRLDSSFWTHRKTIRLQSKIGDAAFWVPQRLWCYAATTQPDGNFSEYQAEELTLALGYRGDAQALLEALVDSGFMNSDHTIHNWDHWNRFHTMFAERARKAANARWGKSIHKNRKVKETKGQYRKGASIAQASSSNASSINGEKLRGIPPEEF